MLDVESWFWTLPRLSAGKADKRRRVKLDGISRSVGDCDETRSACDVMSALSSGGIIEEILRKVRTRGMYVYMWDTLYWMSRRCFDGGKLLPGMEKGSGNCRDNFILKIKLFMTS